MQFSPRLRPASPLAFTLLEMSVVLVIISLMLSGGIAALMAYTSKAAYKSTEQRLQEVSAALVKYRNAYDRLPCPADITLAVDNAGFGVEAGEKGACADANLISGNSVGGMIPTKVLGLDDEVAFDIWGRRIRYAVDKRFTEPKGFLQYSVATAGSLTVEGAGKVYALISHGANGHGGYPRAGGAMFNAGSTNTREQTNCDCTATATAASAFNGTINAGAPTQSTTVTTNNFDDIVISKSRSELGLNETYAATFDPLATWGEFDGVDDYVDVNDVTALNSTVTFSVSGWFKQTTLDVQGGMFGKVQSTSNMIRARTWTDGYMYNYVYNGGVSWGRFDSSTVMTAGTWFHYVMVFDGAQVGNAARLKIYIDGSEVALNFSGTIPSSVPNLAGTDFHIAENFNIATMGAHWNGSIADFRIYNKALTSDEVTWLYSSAASGADPTTANLVAHYMFTEGSGTTVGDSSGNANTGTATNITEVDFWKP